MSWEAAGPPYARNTGDPAGLDATGRPGWAKNQDGTYPFPPPERIGTPLWAQGRTPLTPWVVAPVAQTIASSAAVTIFWDSPMFDLRPELRGVPTSVSTFSTGGQRGAVPIWKNGSGGKLYIQIYNLDSTASALTDLVINALEFGDISNATNSAQIIPPVDVSDQVVGPGISSTLLMFEPPGEGAPMRYWQVRLVFDRLTNLQNIFDISAAYY